MESLPSRVRALGAETVTESVVSGCSQRAVIARDAGEEAGGERPRPGWAPPASAHAWATICDVPHSHTVYSFLFRGQKSRLSNNG